VSEYDLPGYCGPESFFERGIHDASVVYRKPNPNRFAGD
jgi:hypothetical protein